MTWLIGIVGLLFLILIHEAGHFVVALGVGIKPRKFYLGFPPAIAKTTRGGVEYGIGAIPLGGYVRIPGMHRPAAKDVHLNLSPAINEVPELADPAKAVERRLEADDLPGARLALGPLVAAVDDAELSRLARKSAQRGLRDLTESLGEDAYWRQKTWKRIAVISAGPGVNILFAIGVLALVYAIGSPAAVPTRTVAAVERSTPAAASGLRAGDQVVAVNGQPTTTFTAVHARIDASRGGVIRVTVRRNGRTIELPPAHTIRSQGAWIFGFHPESTIRYTSYSAGTSIRLAADDCWLAVKGTAQAIGGLFHKQERGQLTSTVGIVRESNQALKLGFRVYLRLLGFISLALAILNLLPLLPLDGGHILFSIIEGVRRRAVAREVYERASVIGFSLLMLVFLIALNNDIGHRGPG